jgi:tRNA threonylcarbamoyladenosine biosynthesis protein TsaE
MPEASVDSKIVFSLPEIRKTAQTLMTASAGALVWALNGPMGSGKTTLTKAIVAEMGSNETVASPTFSIVNEYSLGESRAIYHFDFYRIKNESEAFDIGVEEYFESGNLCLVEWSEKIPSLLPSRHFQVQLEIIDEHTRLISYQNHG